LDAADALPPEDEPPAPCTESSRCKVPLEDDDGVALVSRLEMESPRVIAPTAAATVTRLNAIPYSVRVTPWKEVENGFQKRFDIISISSLMWTTPQKISARETQSLAMLFICYPLVTFRISRNRAFQNRNCL